MLNTAILEDFRTQSPLIHCISNLVTIQDCANILLAAGGSPIMAQAPQEAGEITRRCAATVLNTGTPDDTKFAACQAAGREANRLGHPVILDPVGVGASTYRLDHMERLLEQVSPTLLRCNLREAQALLGRSLSEKGVDSASAGESAARVHCATQLAQRLNCTVCLSGAADVISDGHQVARLKGGSQQMRMVTGAGCMLSVLLGGFSAAAPSPYQAALVGCAFWKACAAVAAEAAQGAGSFRIGLFDAASTLTASDLSKYIQLEEWSL